MIAWLACLIYLYGDPLPPPVYVCPFVVPFRYHLRSVRPTKDGVLAREGDGETTAGRSVRRRGELLCGHRVGAGTRGWRRGRLGYRFLIFFFFPFFLSFFFSFFLFEFSISGVFHWPSSLVISMLGKRIWWKLAYHLVFVAFSRFLSPPSCFDYFYQH